MCRGEKNRALALRSVSKGFNTALRPYVLKTIQLEFSRFLRTEKALGRDAVETEALERIGGFCQAVYLDMMVVRDEGTLDLLFGRTPARLQDVEILGQWLTLDRGNNSTRRSI